MNGHRFDCIVVGAGIAGLGAALTMEDAGLDVLVLEKEHRPGGRMTTDRLHGFTIDRGVTILGDDFKNMKNLLRRFSLSRHVCPINFETWFSSEQGNRRVRAKRIDDVLFDPGLGFRSKLAMLRLGMDVFFNRNKLLHGKSSQNTEFDTESLAAYLGRINGAELQKKLFGPGLRTAFGGSFEETSKLIFLQTFRNILLAGSWTLDKGVDLLPESMAAQLNLQLNCDVLAIEQSVKGVNVITDMGNYHARAVVFALPGNRVSKLCSWLPSQVSALLDRTVYGKMTNVHAGIRSVLGQECVGMVPSPGADSNYVIELEHRRCRALCPEGKSMASVFWYDDPGSVISECSDEAITAKAQQALKVNLQVDAPEIEFRHLVRWEEGIAKFNVGRLSEVSVLRKAMREWDLPVQLCGDYLDGIASESALQTGIDAGNNMIRYLYRK